jgi:hypothetical protein
VFARDEGSRIRSTLRPPSWWASPAFLLLRLGYARALWMSVHGDDVVCWFSRRPRLLGFHFLTGCSLPGLQRCEASSGRQGTSRAPALAQELTLFTSHRLADGFCVASWPPLRGGGCFSVNGVHIFRRRGLHLSRGRGLEIVDAGFVWRGLQACSICGRASLFARFVSRRLRPLILLRMLPVRSPAAGQALFWTAEHVVLGVFVRLARLRVIAGALGHRRSYKSGPEMTTCSPRGRPLSASW